MPELEITTREDIKKLAGWHIKEAESIMGEQPGVRLILSHPAAEHDVSLSFVAHITMQVSADTVKVLIHFSTISTDVKEGGKE